MLKKTLLYCTIFIIFTSCATDQVNFSPFSESLQQKKSTNSSSFISSYNSKVNTINYSSELTNLLSSFPKFRNEKVNALVKELKFTLQNYLYASEANNKSGEDRYMKSFTNIYKKLQSTKVGLAQDEQDLLNRYLVRIKTNVSMLESSQKDMSAVSKK